MKKYDVKIKKLDNGFVLDLVDTVGDSRVPVMKYVARDTVEIKELLDSIFKEEK